MTINLNLRAPSANPLSFSQVDSNFNQLKQAVEGIQSQLANYSSNGHNHNDLYYLKSEVENRISGLLRISNYTDTGGNGATVDTSHIGRIGWGWGVIRASQSRIGGTRILFPRAYQTWTPVVVAQVVGPVRFEVMNPAAVYPAINIPHIDKTGFSVAIDSLNDWYPISNDVAIWYIAIGGG